MKILITGANGFIGKNLISELKNRGLNDLLKYDLDSPPEILDEYAQYCEFVYHLAGVNRPKSEADFMIGNFDFTLELLCLLKKHNNKSPVLITSSIQALIDNPYGISKKAGEDLLFSYEQDTGAEVLVYRLPNVFGKWCRPNYNSAVATFCNNIAHGLPITVSDPAVTMKLVYVDDVVNEFIRALEGRANRKDKLCYVDDVYTIQLGEIVNLIQSFQESRQTLAIPDMSNEFAKKLYSTYLSYLPPNELNYPLKMNTDNRGSFTEFIKTADRGQVSINISKPGIAKGNHWHHSKNEKFLVISGKGIIRVRKIDSNEIIEYHVSGEKLEVVDIPVGYTHSITNVGDIDMVTVMWANEAFNPDKPDTYYLEV